MKNEALKLALVVLKEVQSETFRLMRNGQKLYAEEKVWNAITAIKEALAQPEQRKSLTKDYTAEDLQNALDRGREIGRREALEEPEQEPEMEDGPELLPVAKIYDWGIEGPRLQGLTNDWPPVGTILFAMKWNS